MLNRFFKCSKFGKGVIQPCLKGDRKFSHASMLLAWDLNGELNSHKRGMVEGWDRLLHSEGIIYLELGTRHFRFQRI